MFSLTCGAVALSVILGAATFVVTPVRAEPVVLQGATTFVSRLLEGHQREIEERSGQTLGVVPTRSFNGLVALLEGRAALAMISTSLETELPLLKRLHPTADTTQLRTFEIARIAVAIAVHPDNPVRSLSLVDLKRILMGELQSWQQLGGPALAIRPIFVREGGGVIQAVKAQVLANGDITAPHAVRVDSPRQLLKIVAQEPGALGLAQERLTQQAGLPQLTTDQKVEQTLNLVSLGPPSRAAEAVIDAARAVAAARLQ